MTPSLRPAATAAWGLFSLLAIWQIGSVVLGNPRVLPAPVSVCLAIGPALSDGLGGDALVSVLRLAGGITIAVGLAVPLALAMALSPAIDRLLSPIVYVLFPLPKVVFLPILFLLFGIDDGSKTALIATILVFQVLVVVRDAARSVRPELVLSVRTLGASRLELLRYVYIPATVPAMFTALRLAAGTAIAVLIFAEQFGGSGLGYYIVTEWGLGDYESMYAGVVVAAAIGLALYAGLAAAERTLCRWQYLTSPA